MAVDMFLKMAPIKGESQDHKHKEEIEILAWSWGMSQTGTTHSGTGGGAAKVSVQDLSFTHWVDKASADLFKACCTGQHFDEAMLTVRKAAGKDAIEYIKIKLQNIIISSVSTGGSNGEERLTENVSLNFQKFEYNYTQQNPDGTPGAKPKFAYDMAANKEV
jgi:type VI secretion system secreted protein Hcp